MQGWRQAQMLWAGPYSRAPRQGLAPGLASCRYGPSSLMVKVAGDIPPWAGSIGSWIFPQVAIRGAVRSLYA